MKYAELDNVIYRAKDGFFFDEKLVGGEWKPNASIAKVRVNASPMDEAEAKEFAGEAWPATEKVAEPA